MTRKDGLSIAIASLSAEPTLHGEVGKFPFIEFPNTCGVLQRVFSMVFDHDEAAALLEQRRNRIHHRRCVCVVELTEKFISQDELWSMGKGSCCCNTAFLSAGKTSNRLCGLVFHAHFPKRLHRLLSSSTVHGK